MYLLIDIGGTKTRMTVTEHREAFVDPSVFRTSDEFEAWIHEVRNKSIELTHGRKIQGVVVGIPGKFSKEGVLEHLPNLKKWNGVPMKQRLESIFSCPIIMENDTALVGLGEAVYGAGKGHSIVAYHTISTGVNGVRIVNGKYYLWRSS
jgi:glucokinase